LSYGTYVKDCESDVRVGGKNRDGARFKILQLEIATGWLSEKEEKEQL
jgi:hypothetical protein